MKARIHLKGVLVLAAALLLLFSPVSSRAVPIDTITYSMSNPSGSMPAGMYGTVRVDLISATEATITMTAAGYPLIALGDSGILALNPTGSWEVSSKSIGLTDVGSGKVDGIGYFRLIFDDGPGFSNPYESVYVTLDLTSGSWLTASGVLTSTVLEAPSQHPSLYMVGGHFGISSGTTYNPTGWVGSDGVIVPEPATILLLGSGLVALWGIRRKLRK